MRGGVRAGLAAGLLLAALTGVAEAQVAPLTPVVVAPLVEREVPPAIRLVGTVLPDKTATVAAEVAGVVVERPAEEGHFLRRGEVLCRLDREVARFRLEEATAELERRKAQLAELESGERPEELRRLEAVVAEAEARHQQWKVERERIESLYQAGQSNPKERHDTNMEYLAAEGRLAQARAALDKARSGPRAEEIARARFAVAAQAAVVGRGARDLAKTEVRAPFDGFVTRRRVEVGEWIEAGGAVAELVALETVRVRTDVPESAVAFAQPGAPATVEVDALGRRLVASVSRLIPQAAAAARTFPIEIDLPNGEGALLAGMFVWVNVPAGPPGKRLMASQDAIVTRGLSKQVFVVRPGPNGSHLAVPVSVTTGLEVRGEVEVAAPELRPGDPVVVRGNERLMGPTPVQPMPAPSTQPAAGPPGATPPGGAATETQPSGAAETGAREPTGGTERGQTPAKR